MKIALASVQRSVKKIRKEVVIKRQNAPNSLQKDRAVLLLSPQVRPLATTHGVVERGNLLAACQT